MQEEFNPNYIHSLHTSDLDCRSFNGYEGSLSIYHQTSFAYLFCPFSLRKMDEKERAKLNKIQADGDAVYLANGVISQEKVRQRLSLDRYSGYTMIDVDDVPSPQQQPLENTDKEEQDEEDRQAMDVAMDLFSVSVCPIKECFFGGITCVFDNNFNPEKKEMLLVCGRVIYQMQNGKQ